ncbi:nitronate monooxygenase [Mycolicibacter sinensis]|uniref:nitronate monooxygenase n=1 Tax=Mycolicibacter sinensis (strain JDM601) TaxID=875328 RepID=UPI0007E95D05|nr:nitronate monooxygenase [Mycolicibacter sinensis]OBH17962.1 2-nitropropane dioxygenase [Mycolicibacter sinensis]
MTTPLSTLGLALPVIAAPMSGGPSTPAMVHAASDAGGFGFLAAGYKTPDALAAEIAAVRARTSVFGVNVFVPNRTHVDAGAYRAYASLMQHEADRFGLTLPAEPIEDDDCFGAKVDLLVSDPVPLVSFTFGLPDGAVVQALKAVGTTVIQTVTSAAEAAQAADVGVDMLAVQSRDAGGHSGTFTPDRPPPPQPLTELIAQIRATVGLPVIAAGGLATATQVAEAIHAGAAAAMVGTALLRADESGASSTHQAALTDPRRTETVVTRAFSGRPARGLRNTFIDTYESRAPLGYPAIHHLTSPLRKAAAAAGEPDLVHLWAGTGYRHAAGGSTSQILRGLAGAV